MFQNDTICALATAQGLAAIAVIRLSGKDAIEIADKVFYKKDKSQYLNHQKSHTLHFGDIKDGEKWIDEVLISVFKGPNSYTGENTVEISCHGSVFIQKQIIELLLKKGARMANPGEFTLRAFLNGKLDLSQAEAVADLIASDSEASHKMAMQQMRGGFSKDINDLREKLIHFASLIELELDFAEEDVEFANRKDLKDLVENIQSRIKKLVDSFAQGNVFKNGVPVAIIGKPNVGKSTLLNALLNEDRAIVSEIAGTTRDTIEEEISIGGIVFRFIDTAGIRNTIDKIESIGIEKSFEKIAKASIVLYLFDLLNDDPQNVKNDLENIRQKMGNAEKPLLIIGNKADQNPSEALKIEFAEQENVIFISAKQNQNISQLTDKLLSYANAGLLQNDQTLLSNARHLDALNKTLEALNAVLHGLNNNITGDFLALDIRTALRHLGEITGVVEVDRDILGTIFSKFCIGK